MARSKGRFGIFQSFSSSLSFVIESPRWSDPTYPAFQGIENEHDDENDNNPELERIITRLFSQLTLTTDNFSCTMAPTNNLPGVLRHSMKEVVPIAILTIGAILVSLPLLWMFSTSLRPSSESYKLPPQWLPTQFHFENYGALFGSSVPFFTLFLNSLKITAAVTGGQLVFCSMAGFAFARLHFPARHLLFILLLASLMVPNQATVIPIFLLMRTFGLIDTHLSIILPGLVSAFGVFMMRQFYLTLPQELIDAARLDGAGPWRIYTRIALPLSTPALAALGIISFNTTWNSYFYPLIFLNSWDQMTLPQGIALLQGYMQSGNPSVVMAAVTMAILPVLAIFLIAQRWIVEAFVSAGIKG